MYISCSIYKVSFTWDLKPPTLVLCSNACSTELASLTKERSSTVNVYTRSDSKEHKVVYGYWQLGRFEPHLM